MGRGGEGEETGVSIYIYNGANSAKRTSKGGEKRRGEDAIGDSAVVFARSEVRCIILLE